jgi:hypothetical protein
MSYSQLVLSQRPSGYWDCASLVSGELEDLTSYNNHAQLVGVETNKKPIIYGPQKSVRLTDNSQITISNNYKVFIRGSEDKSATIELFFNIKDSAMTKHEILSIGQFASCYIISDKIYLEADGRRASIQVGDWDNTQYVAIQYSARSVSMYFNDSDPVSVSLSSDFYFPDATAPSIIIGPSASLDLAIYVNSIALYTYPLLKSEIEQRLSWAGYSSKADRLAISNNAEILNPIQSDSMVSYNYDLMQKNFISQGVSDNVVYENNAISLRSLPPVSIFSNESSLSYTITEDGLSLGPQCFVKLTDIAHCFNGYSNIISQQILLDGLSTKQTILEFGPFSDKSSITIYKSASNKFVLSKISWEDVETVLAQSPDLGSDYTLYFNVALVINNGNVSLIVDEYESSTTKLAVLSNGYEFYVGNSFDIDSPCTSIIKNFSISDYSEDILFTETGRYTLKFNKSFNVSQKGTWEYQLNIPENCISSSVSYNNASKNARLYVNGEEIFEPTFIPQISYSSQERVLFSVELISSDSVTDIPVFSNLNVRMLGSSDVSSGNGVYSITPLSINSTDTYTKVNPYIVKLRETSPLAKPSNLGIKFVSQPNYVSDYLDPNVGEGTTDTWDLDPTRETSGASVGGNKDIKILEFILQLDRAPGDSEEFTILQVRGSAIKIAYNKNGLILNSGYSLYLDGVLCTGGEDILVDEVYHFAVVFTSAQSSRIHLGINNNQDNGISASLGNFAIHETAPASLSDYLAARTQAIFGRYYISKIDTDSLDISDTPVSTQQFYRTEDGKYFEMKELPRVKIVQNLWETLQ